MASRNVAMLSLEAARVGSDAAQDKAQQLGIDVNIAFVDSALHLLHFVRMGNAKLSSISTAIDKAFTAAGHHNPTSEYSGNPNFLPGGKAYGIHNTNGGRFVLLSGGIPIVIDGDTLGAIGVGSGTPEQDIECATAGIEAIEAFARRS
ncbi:hypothetical protein KC357_g9114 [Hortaea werneckii]|nr:hypothetical protein KC357_g9114 [Hortaea werneckii]